MFYVLDCITQDHDLLLVILAVAIWLTGGTSLFILLRRAGESSLRRARQWQGLAALTSGVAVWGTHFVAMLGYQASVPFSFAFDLTALSVLVAVVLFYAAIRLHDGLTGLPAMVAAGTFFAAGVAAMHFTGMAAIRAPALVIYDLSVILWGQLVATLAAILAFAAIDRFAGMRGVVVGAAFSLVSVAAMHFTAMAATQLVPDSTITVVEMSFERETLVVATVFATVILVMLALGSAVFDRYLTDMRGLSDATQDGIVILWNDRVVEVNARFSALSGFARDRIVGARSGDFLAAVAPGEQGPVEARLQLNGGGTCPVEVSQHLIEYRGRDCDILSLRDLTAIKESQRRVTWLAHHDALTGLPNRAAMETFLAEALARSRESGSRVAVLAFDLDAFKSVNDVFGHHEGDRVLVACAGLLRDSIRDCDLACRIGGDEFIVVQILGDDSGAAHSLAQRIITAFDDDLRGSKTFRNVGTSIGIAIYPDDAPDGQGLLQAADMALYRAKETGRGTVRSFDPAMENGILRRRELEQRLGQAIAQDELWLAYQPIFDCATGRITGYEAILHWAHPGNGDIAPDVIFPIAEQTGLILQIAEWALSAAGAEARNWPDDVKLVLNLGQMQLWPHAMVEMVDRVLRSLSLPPGRLDIALAGRVLLHDSPHVASAIAGLRALGVGIVMDDFETGFSTLSGLRQQRFDKIMLDRGLTADLENDTPRQAIIRAIVALGRAMQLPVVARGVETRAQLSLLSRAGCTEVQGQLLGAPGLAPSGAHDGRARA